jgi:Carboxypeptidase regulatory-like domain
MIMCPSPSTLRPVVAGVLLLIASTLSANVCVSPKPNPLSHVCGVIVDSSGIPIPNAKVKILKGGIEATSVATGENGEFDFQHLDAATYEIQVEMPGFITARYDIVVKRPSGACKKMLMIELRVGGMDLCPAEIRLVKKTTH